MDAKNILHDIAGTIETAAPLLAGLLTGGSSTAIALGVNLLSNAFNADPKNPQDLLAKIQQTSDSGIKAQQLEYQHQEAILSLQQKDADSAREMPTPNYIRIGLMLFLGVLLVASMVLNFVCNNQDAHQQIGMFIVQLLFLGKLVYTFYFGGRV